MTQAVCSDNKKFPAKRNLFAFTLKKNLGVVIIGISLAVLICAYIATNFIQHGVYNEGRMADYIREITIIFITGSCLIETLLALLNFNYLYSKPATDMFHSMPVSSGGLLFVRTAAAYAGAAMAWLASMGIFWITSAFIFSNLVSAWVILELIFNGLLIMFVYASVLAFHAVIAGNILGFIFSMAVTQIGIPVISIILQSFGEEALIGYSSNVFLSDGLFANFSVMFKGIWLFVMRVSNCFSTDFVWQKYVITVLLSLLVAAVIFVLATVIYKKRKSETAGTAFSFGWVKWGSVIVATILVSHLVGLIFASGEVGFDYWFFAAVGAVIAAIIICAVTDKGFQNIKKSIVSAVVSVLVLALSFGGVSICANNYNSFIPKEKDIKTVIVSTGNLEVKFTLGLDSVTGLHRDFVDVYSKGDISDNSNVIYEYAHESPIGEYVASESISIEYQLLNGRTVKRVYYSTPDIYDSILKFKKTDNYRDVLLKPIMYNEIQLSLNDSGEYEDGYNYSLTNTQFQEILNVYYDDMCNLTSDDLKAPVDFSDTVNVYGIIFDKNSNEIEKQICVPITEQFENTLLKIEQTVKVDINTDNPEE